MIRRLSLLVAAAAIALVGVYNMVDDSSAGDEQEFQRGKCIENCG